MKSPLNNEIHPDPKLKGMSYSDFLLNRDRNPTVEAVKQRLLELDPEESKDIEFDDKMQFLIQTVEDFKKEQALILELWEFAFKIIENADSSVQSLNNSYFYMLVSLTGKAEIEKKKLEQLDLRLDASMKGVIQKRFEMSIGFQHKVDEILDWYKLRYEYLDYLKLSISYGEAAYMKKIANDYGEEFEKLKTVSPMTFIIFFNIFKKVYKSCDTDYQSKFSHFYLEKSLEQVICAKNSGHFVGYESLLRDYYTELLKEKKALNFLFRIFTGYGERPWRLIYLFLLVNLVFAIIFFLFPFAFDFNVELKNCERFLSFIYFNNTTMLTVGYGDIYPVGAGAKITVALLQIIGFAISSSAVALFLRKVLRF